MADLKIYNNGENKILFSAGDRIIRQPYDFGKAFQNRMELNNYILVQGLSIPLQPITKIIWTYYTTIENVLVTLKGNNLNNYNIYTQASGKVFARNSQPGGTSFPIMVTPVVYSSLNLLGVGIASVSEGVEIINGFISEKTFTNSIIDELTTDIIISAIIHNNTNLTPQLYNTSAKFNRLSLFSRVLTKSECLFYFNNKIGSTFQSTEGIELDLYCDVAEILNTGSGDFVGVRDYSGNNRHGRIMNLPAGTLQEQLDWANANLFVPFIS